MSKLNRRLTRIAACAGVCAAALASGTAFAYEAGDWTVRVGSHYVDPKSDNNDAVGVDGAFGLTFAVDYFVTPTLAIDLLGAAPYEHDITLNADGSEVASTKHLPPTLSLIWYPQLSTKMQPFVGAGVNYTIFFDESTKGALSGADLSLDNSFGIAAVAGLDVALTPKWSLTADVRWMDIDTKAKVNGSSIGDVEIDPLAYGVALNYHF